MPLLDGRARTGRCACPAGGEQQRLGVARALVNKPDWLFLDEATAGLDPEAEARMCVQLKRRLPGTTITSIGQNRPSGGSTDGTWVLDRTDGMLLPPRSERRWDRARR